MELSYFVDEYLYPAIWGRLNEVFPEMGFNYTTGKWRSPKSLDGSTPQTKRKDKTVVTQRYYQVAIENGGGDSKGRARDLISLYMEHNNVGDRIEAIKRISNTLGLVFPEGANSQKYESLRERREGLALSYDRQKRALFSPEGAETLRYLKEERGYSEELIKEMGLGYISPDEARLLEDKYRIGIAWRVEDYPLSIAYFSRGNVMGFKFRSIRNLEGKSKYMNTKSLGSEGMDNNPFGLTPSNLNLTDKKAEVIIVEGELDALHAIALGVPNVIAVAGGRITEGKANALKKCGYKNIVILLDSDGAGQQFTEESIERVDSVGLNSFVATLPDSKDTDEYLQKHSIEEFSNVIKSANFGGLWIYFKERGKYLNSPQSDIDFINFLDSYVKIASRYKDKVKRDLLYSYLLKDFDNIDIESIKKGLEEKIEENLSGDKESLKENALETIKEASATLTDEAKKERDSELEEVSRLQEALKVIKVEESRKKALQDIKIASAYLTDGKEKEPTQALKTIEDANKALRTLRRTGADGEYSFLLEDNTEELWRLYKESEIGLRTKFVLTNKEEGDIPVDYTLTFPSGAVSIIGALTGHGKSKMLQNITLDALDETKDGETLLYITYEENELGVNMQFLNVYANLNIKPDGAKGSNAQSIMNYLTSGDTDNLRADKKEEFLAREKEWKSIRHSRKIKIVKPEDNYLETLQGLIEFSVQHFNIKAILIDYVQEIYVQEWAKYSRTDELKAAMVTLDAMAQRLKIPIIMGAQLNNETKSPLDLYNQNIADSSWIGRKASEILLIWSSTEKCRGEGAQKTEKRVAEEIPNFELNKPGKLFFKMTKSRVIPKGATAIVDIKGSTGKIGEKLKGGTKREPQQTTLFRSQDEQTTQPDDNVVVDTDSQKPYRRGSEEEGDGLPF